MHKFFTSADSAQYSALDCIAGNIAQAQAACSTKVVAGYTLFGATLIGLTYERLTYHNDGNKEVIAMLPGRQQI